MISENAVGYFDNPRVELVQLFSLAMSQNSTPKLSVVEVGCGAGANFQLYRDAGFELLHGVEVHRQMADVATARFDQVYAVAVEEFQPLGVRYHAVVVGDVLEHLVDPWLVLRRIYDWSAYDAVLAVSIPNAQNWTVVWPLIRGRWDYTADGILDRTHLRFFTDRSFQEVLRQTGWKVQIKSHPELGPKGRLLTWLSGGRLEPFMVGQYYYICVKQSLRRK